MTASTANLPLRGTMAGFRRFSVAEYHRLIEIGILTEDDSLELIDGYLVHKMPRNPPHDGTLHRALDWLTAVRPVGWKVRVQAAITLRESEPEPDFALVRQDPDDYTTRHPGPGDIGLVIEIADSSLPSDRADKLRIYADAGLAEYWIVNVVDRQVEVYTVPSGPAATPTYSQRKDYRPGNVVPFVLEGQPVAQLVVADLLR